MKRLVLLSFIVFSLMFLTTCKSMPVNESIENIQNTSSLSGKVVETMDSGRYTYVCIEKNEEKIWVAVYKTKVVVGQDISFKPGIEMVNFESKTLGRKFDKIIFSEGSIDYEGTKK